MKRISSVTWELITRLHREDFFLNSLLNKSESVLEILGQIAATEEPASIPHFAGLLVDRRDAVREAVAHALATLVASLSPADWVQLDETCRREWVPSNAEQFGIRHIKPADVKHLAQLPHSPVCIGIATFHPSGFVREEALKHLGKISDGSELPFLFLRLNDWVSSVRELAAAEVRNRIRPHYAKHFVGCLSFVLRLEACGRAQHSSIINAVTELLKQPAAHALLRAGIRSHDRSNRHACLRLALELEGTEASSLLTEALDNADPIVRIRSARSLLARSQNMDLAMRLLSDPFPAVRCEALQVFANDSNNVNILLTALCDPSASVRAVARHYLRTKQAQLDVAATYRELLTRTANNTLRLSTAILGLGETGTPADSDLLRNYANYPSIKVRKAAIRSITMLNAERHADFLMSAVQDNHPGVSRQATTALLKHRNLISFETARSLFRTHPKPFVRTNAFRLLLLLPFWQRGLFLFEALRDGNETIVGSSLRELSCWILKTANYASRPTESDLQSLEDSLKASSGMLSTYQVTVLRSCITSWQK